MGMSGDKDPSLVPAIQDILGALNDAEKLFWADLALTSRRGAVPHVREASMSLAMIRALQSSLGKASVNAPLLAARLLGARAMFLVSCFVFLTHDLIFRVDAAQMHHRRSRFIERCWKRFHTSSQM